MNGNAKILFFCMIFVGGTAFGQNYTEKLTITTWLHRIKPEQPFSMFIKKNITADTVAAAKRASSQTVISTAIFLNPGSYSLISPNYYTQNFGFFCKKELQIEKITKIPFKFRLGSVQQCDWMEGKPNAVK